MSGLDQTWILAVGLMVAALGTTSVLGALLERSNPIRLSHWVEKAGGRLRTLYDRPRRFEAFRFLMTLSCLFLLGALVALVVISPWGALARWWMLAGLTLLMAVLELVNRRVVRKDPETALNGLTRLYRLAVLVFAPALPLLGPLMPNTANEDSEEEEDEASEQEIEAFIDVGTREGILDDGDGALLRSVVDFGDTRVRSVMTPRIDMLCAPADSTLEELITIFVESTHSRIPLYESSIDHIVGLLHIRDLLRAIRNGDGQPARNLAKEVWFVPESRALDEVLKELQERRQQLAVVVDEYGGTSGLVTIEDLLEEIVGDIVDQDEEAPPQMLEESAGRWRFDGRVRIDELARIFDLTLDDDSVDTVGGMVFSAFGYVPAKGDTVDVHGLRLTVEKVHGRRIQSVLVEAVPVKDVEEVLDAG
jgi:magnesium and cobalt exporter, CNNM family